MNCRLLYLSCGRCSGKGTEKAEKPKSSVIPLSLDCVDVCVCRCSGAAAAMSDIPGMVQLYSIHPSAQERLVALSTLDGRSRFAGFLILVCTYDTCCYHIMFYLVTVYHTAGAVCHLVVFYPTTVITVHC